MECGTCGAVRCRDPDDQMLIDLALAYRAQLLRMAKRLMPLAVAVGPLGSARAPSLPVRAG